MINNDNSQIVFSTVYLSPLHDEQGNHKDHKRALILRKIVGYFLSATATLVTAFRAISFHLLCPEYRSSLN